MSIIKADKEKTSFVHVVMQLTQVHTQVAELTKSDIH